MTIKLFGSSGLVTPFAVAYFYTVQDSNSFILTSGTKNTVTNNLPCRLDAYFWGRQEVGLIQKPFRKSTFCRSLVDISVEPLGRWVILPSIIFAPFREDKSSSLTFFHRNKCSNLEIQDRETL